MKKLLAITVVGLLLCSNAYAGLCSKKPILVCNIEGKSYTFNLKKMPMWPKKAPWPKNEWITEISDQYYNFTEVLRFNGGRSRLVRYSVDRYSGVINGYMTKIAIKGSSDAFSNLKTPDVYFNGTCKSAK